MTVDCNAVLIMRVGRLRRTTPRTLTLLVRRAIAMPPTIFKGVFIAPAITAPERTAEPPQNAGAGTVATVQEPVEMRKPLDLGQLTISLQSYSWHKLCATASFHCFKTSDKGVGMKRVLGSAVMAAMLTGAPQVHADTIYGVWSNPILTGDTTDAVDTMALTHLDNTTSAVVSISNNAGSSTINWGTWSQNGITNPPGQSDAAGCAFLLSNNGLPCQSTVTFTGATVPADPKQPFKVGSFTYANGTSNLDSLIFFATLTFFETSSSVSIGSDLVQFNTTNNTGNDDQNADYITFSGLAGQSDNAREGMAPTIVDLNGFIDDLTLTSITFVSGNGFVGNSLPIPLTAPEPAGLALVGVALAGLGLARRRRR